MTRERPRERVLVVVDRAIVDLGAVPDVASLMEGQAREVVVVAPILTSRLSWLANDDARARDEASERLESVLERMRSEQGIAANGRLGDESPLAAIDDALVDFPADEIIITVHDDDHAHWHERGLAEKIRARHSQPLTEVVVTTDGLASTRG